MKLGFHCCDMFSFVLSLSHLNKIKNLSPKILNQDTRCYRELIKDTDHKNYGVSWLQEGHSRVQLPLLYQCTLL